VNNWSRATNAPPEAEESKALNRTAAQGSTRIRSLDVLRGVGVLGMLATHIQLFAFPSLARWNPTAYGDLQGLNWWVWLATSVLADGKFIAIFAMLLGVSIVMLAGGAEAPLNQMCFGAFAILRAMSTRNDDPTTDVMRPAFAGPSMRH